MCEHPYFASLPLSSACMYTHTHTHTHAINPHTRMGAGGGANPPGPKTPRPVEDASARESLGVQSPMNIGTQSLLFSRQTPGMKEVFVASEKCCGVVYARVMCGLSIETNEQRVLSRRIRGKRSRSMYGARVNELFGTRVL